VWGLYERLYRLDHRRQGENLYLFLDNHLSHVLYISLLWIKRIIVVVNANMNGRTGPEAMLNIVSAQNAAANTGNGSIMNIEKHSGKLSIGIIVGVIGVAISSVGFVVANAEDMMELKTQIPAIVETQKVEAEHQKERYENVKEDIKEQGQKLEKIFDLMLQINRAVSQ